MMSIKRSSTHSLLLPLLEINAIIKTVQTENALRLKFVVKKWYTLYKIVTNFFVFV